MTRLVVGTRLRLRELTRQPLTLALLLLLPPLVIEMYGVAVESFPQLPSLGADPATAGRMTGALFAVAFLAGLIGLFQVISARNGDERATIAGFPRGVLLASRIVSMLVVAVLATGIAFLAFSSRVTVTAPALAFGVLFLAAVVYGFLGVVVGTLVPRELEGSIVLVFLADIDNALSSGLFPIEAVVSLPGIGSIDVTNLVPLYHPHELFSAAVLGGKLTIVHLAPTVAWILGLLAFAFVAYGQVAGERVSRRGESP
ncbi:MAG: ABC transporter permease [Halodesulfurarchaeum sp.]